MTSALDGGEWSASRPGRAFTPGERTPGTHCTGGWVGLRADLDTEDRGKNHFPLPGIEPRSPVVRHYTAWATRVLILKGTEQNTGPGHEVEDTDPVIARTTNSMVYIFILLICTFHLEIIIHKQLAPHRAV
jgi:hypothetical protein